MVLVERLGVGSWMLTAWEEKQVLGLGARAGLDSGRRGWARALSSQHLGRGLTVNWTLWEEEWGGRFQMRGAALQKH